MNGSFTIPSLDPTLLFNLLAVAPGYKPTFLKRVDPQLGPVRFELPAQPNEAEGKVLRGRVLAPDGTGVLGATVSPYGKKTGERAMYGSIPGLDPLAVTDEEGRFALHGAETGSSYDVEVRARALAVGFFKDMEPGEGAKLTLGLGATVEGRLTHDGRPLVGTTVGLVQADRGTNGFAGELTIATDADGRFTFLNAVAGQRLFVYAKMASMKGGLAVAWHDLASPADGDKIDVGELQAIQGFELTGRIELSDGKPVPAGTRLLVSREHAWDSLTVEVASDGSFALAGLPAEQYSLSVRVRGYRLSGDNHSFDPLNRGSLVGWIKESKSGMRVVLEPGAIDYSVRPGEDAIQQFIERRKAPMRGAEEN